MSRFIKRDIEDLANHAANMVSIMECYEDLGRPKPKVITDELERVLSCLTEELENASRTIDLFETGGEKDGTSAERSEPVRSSTVGPSPVSPRREIVRRPWVGSTDGQVDSASSGKPGTP